MAEMGICDPGEKGTILPLIAEENEWPKVARFPLYFVALLYCFLGVSIVADLFMGAIEAVTSKRRIKVLPCGRQVAVKCWNATVANLTLMALGSSAPEILLSMIELLSADMYSGDLGPGSIVGSAAFNGLVILAVCVYVIPDGESRTIARPAVFYVTATFSVFAYLWLILILAGSTPNLVTPVEGVLSFLWFPLLVVLAYLADIRQPRFLFGATDEDGAPALMALEAGQEQKTRAARRMENSAMTKPKKPKTKFDSETVSVGFLTAVYSFPRTNKVRLEVERRGSSAACLPMVVHYTVVHGSDSSLASAELPVGSFGGTLEIEVPEDNGVRGSQPFHVNILSAYSVNPFNGAQSHAVVSEDFCRAKVLLTDDAAEAGSKGQLRLAASHLHFQASATGETTCNLKVERFNGCAGEVTCEFATEEDTAKKVFDFFHSEGTLTFPSGVLEQTVQVRISPKDQTESEDRFFINLSGDVVVKDSASCCVTILPGHDGQFRASDKILRAADTLFNLDAVYRGNDEWKAQFRAAMQPVSGEGEDLHEATAADWAMHFISLPWKLLFAFIPPTQYCGGWFSFFVCLAVIGFITAIIGDLAELAGCCVNMPNAITAITIVALGTSLPDTFASKVAALEDESADAAIGNVTGSNSVNVFLGLGLPWMVAAFYWNGNATPEWALRYPEQALIYPEGGFVVLAGDLTLSVAVFSLCSCLALGVIQYRRAHFNAELGGPVGMKFVTAVFFVLLWVYYVSVACWKILTPDAALPAQILMVGVGLLTVLLVMAIIIGVYHFVSTWRAEARKREQDRIGSMLAGGGGKNLLPGPNVFGASAPTTSDNNLELKAQLATLTEQVLQLQRACTVLTDSLAAQQPPQKAAESLEDGGAKIRRASAGRKPAKKRASGGRAASPSPATLAPSGSAAPSSPRQPSREAGASA